MDSRGSQAAANCRRAAVVGFVAASVVPGAWDGDVVVLRREAAAGVGGGLVLRGGNWVCRGEGCRFHGRRRSRGDGRGCHRSLTIATRQARAHGGGHHVLVLRRGLDAVLLVEMMRAIDGESPRSPRTMRELYPAITWCRHVQSSTCPGAKDRSRSLAGRGGGFEVATSSVAGRWHFSTGCRSDWPIPQPVTRLIRCL